MAASTSSPIPAGSDTSSPIPADNDYADEEIIMSSQFMKIIQDLGKEVTDRVNPALMQKAMDEICNLFGNVPVAGICVRVLRFIIVHGLVFSGNTEKRRQILKDAEFLRDSIMKISSTVGDVELLTDCMATLTEVAYDINSEISRKQKWETCLYDSVCGLINANPEAKVLDGVSTKLTRMRTKVSLFCETEMLVNVTDIYNQVPKPCSAPLADPSIRLETEEELLAFIRKPEIRILAVCGMGGIGKTTLLQVLYDKEFPREGIQRKAFVEVGMKADIMESQKQILRLLENKAETFINAEQGRNGLRDCLLRLKAEGFSLCLCIDNVWKTRDLNALLPSDVYDCLPGSSCVMLSTRSRQVANAFRYLCTQRNANANTFRFFEPTLMGIQQAEQLFMHCAKIEDKNKELNLLKEIIPLCAGLPLAIKTYGTHFRLPERRTETYLREFTRRILDCAINPSNADDDDGQVLGSLEPSIEFQSTNVQDAFIDAALFWRQKPLEKARYALYDRDNDILQVLLDESIFYSRKYTWDKETYLECHDLFLPIAQKRANFNNWKYLERQALPEGVEGIRGLHIIEPLPIQTLQNKLSSLKYLHCINLIGHASDISQCEKHDLKFLQISESLDPSHLQFFPKIQALTMSQGFQYGVESTLVHHQILSSLFETFGNLRIMDIDGSNNKLSELPASFGNMEHLQVFKFRNFSCLETFPSFSRPLSSKYLSERSQLACLPDVLSPLPTLRELDLSGCYQLTHLPDTLGPLPALEKLDLSGCFKLARLPDSLGPLPALQWLDLSRCCQLSHLPNSLGALTTLRWLDLSRCNQLSHLPDSLGPLPALEVLRLVGCSQLSSLPEALSTLPALKELDLSECFQLPRLLKIEFGNPKRMLR